MDAYNPIFYRVYLLVSSTSMSRTSCAYTILALLTALGVGMVGVVTRCREFKFDHKELSIDIFPSLNLKA